MKRLAIALVLLAVGIYPALAQKTKAQLTTEVGTTFPDNTAGLITPAGVRAYETDVLNSIMPTAPVVSGNLACFNGTTGLLQDCGIGPSKLVIGTTAITSGSTTNILFNNAGVLGEYTISGTGSVAMTGSPSITTPTISTPTITGHPTVEGVTSTGATGTGAFVFGTSPTISSPNLTGTPTGSAASTTVNGQTCTLGSTCTISASAGTITPGTTAIASGTDKGLLYDNAGILGNLATANSGVLVTSGAGVPSISTSLPSGLTIPSPTISGTISGSGVIPSAALVSTAVSPSSYGSSTSIPSFTVNQQGQLTAAAGNVVVAPAGTLTGATLASNVLASSLTSVGTIATGGWQGTVIGLPYGGTNNNLIASNGGIVWSDASKLNILAGTVTAGQCLLSGSSASPTWGSCAGGATVTSIAGNTGAFTLAAGVTNSTNQIQMDGNYTGFGLSNCTIAASVSTNNLTVSLKDNAGNNPSATSPCYVNFRNATAATGSTVLRAVTSAASFTANAGSTFGISNSAGQCDAASSCPFRLWVTLVDTGSGVEVGVIALTNASGVRPLTDTQLVSPTACSACTNANAIGTMYTTSGQTTKPVRILGYLDWGSGLATAGSYATGPTTIQVMGPGVKRPGDIVQQLQTTATSQTTTTSTSYSTALTQAITPTASANIVRAIAATATVAGASTNSGSVGIFNSTSSSIVVQGRVTGSSTGFLTMPGGLDGFDVPGSTSSQSYILRVRSDGTNSTGVCAVVNAGDNCTLTVYEIQG